MQKKNKILVINGPNLNLLGQRENQFYGTTTLEELNATLEKEGKKLGFAVEFFQSNTEGEIVTAIQESAGKYAGRIINPAAYTHSSVAIRDALLAAKLPTIEVHLSNIYAREEFRHHSYIAPVVNGQISGLGTQGYSLALQALAELLS